MAVSGVAWMRLVRTSLSGVHAGTVRASTTRRSAGERGAGNLATTV
jgi:hypothetical protein